MSCLYRRGLTYWISYYLAGTRHFRSLGTRNKRAALLAKAKLDSKLLIRRSLARESDLLVADAFAKYLEDTALRRGAKEQRNECCRMRRLVEAFAPEQRLSLLTKAEIERVLMTLKIERHWSSSTYNHYRKTVLGMLRWAIGRGYLIEELMELPRLKETPYERRWIPYERWGEFLRLGRRSTYGPLAAIALLTGLRPKELLAIEWRDVDWTRKLLTIRAEIAKNRRTRYVPLPDRALAILKRLRQPDGRIFEGFSQGVFEDTVHRWLKRMGLDGRLLGPYVLRHSYAARMAELLPAFQIQQLLGHEDIATTQRYVHAHELRLPHEVLRKL